jgi:hypothetical protein
MKKEQVIKKFLHDKILNGSVKVKADIPGVTKSYIKLENILIQFYDYLCETNRDGDKN